jgi:hypothetical protein
MNPITRYIIKLLFVILLQVVALKNLELGAANWWITPFVYFVIILDLPVKFNPLLSMLIGLVFGLVIDAFYDTYGLHASAAVALSFCRYYLAGFVLPRDGFDTGSSITFRNVGSIKFLVYIGVLSLIYHLWFFAFEAFTLDSFLLRLSQAFVSSLSAMGILIILHFAFVKFDKY